VKSSDTKFHGYLRREVRSAAKNFEQARTRLLALTAVPEPEISPALTEATEFLSEALRLYTGALRRLVHYSAHQSQIAPPTHFDVGREAA